MNKKSDAIAMGADAVYHSKKRADILLLSRQFDFILSTLNVQMAWDSYIQALKPSGRLHFLTESVDSMTINGSAMVTGQKTLSV